MKLSLSVKDIQEVLQPNAPLEIVLAEKEYHKGFLHGLAEGGGVISFPTLPQLSLRISALEGNKSMIQLVTRGKDNPMRTQFYTRPKQVIEKIIIKQQQLKATASAKPEIKNEFKFENAGVEEI